MKNGNVLSSFTEASWSTSFPFFLSIKKRAIGNIKPNIKAIKIVAICFDDSDSKVNAKIVNIIIVKDGGTKSVEMNLANLCDRSEFKLYSIP